MKASTDSQSLSYEKTLISIARTLPPERVAQLIDFARFLQERVTKPVDDELNEEVTVNDERWDELLAKPDAQSAMNKMAREAREEFRYERMLK